MAIPLTLSEKKAEAALAKVSILVVDSDETIRELVSKVLLHLGFKNIRGASHGYEGIQIFREEKIDLIITDWELKISPESNQPAYDSKVIINEWGEFPPNNGASFVKFIRSGKGGIDRFVPIIMLTGPTTPNAIMYARDSGVSEVLMKPLDSRNLCNRIINIIDHPRPFVTSENYTGPCRRRKQLPWEDKEERRIHKIEVIKFEEHKKASKL